MWINDLNRNPMEENQEGNRVDESRQNVSWQILDEFTDSEGFKKYVHSMITSGDLENLIWKFEELAINRSRWDYILRSIIERTVEDSDSSPKVWKNIVWSMSIWVDLILENWEVFDDNYKMSAIRFMIRKDMIRPMLEKVPEMDSSMQQFVAEKLLEAGKYVDLRDYADRFDPASHFYVREELMRQWYDLPGDKDLWDRVYPGDTEE